MADGTLTHVQALKEGKTVKFRPHGNSMRPIIESGQLVTVEPLNDRVPEVGDAVLCKVNGRQMLHKVTAIGSDGRYQISNNHGHINGWCTLANIYGILTAVEP
jgi:Peptidase S24-like